jgi:hypothetical protein
MYSLQFHRYQATHRLALVLFVYLGINQEGEGHVQNK